jgi:hypothetical protein
MTTKINDFWERPRYRQAAMLAAGVVLVVGLLALFVQHNRVSQQHYNATPNPSPFAKDGDRIAVPKQTDALTQTFVNGAAMRKDLPAAWAVSTAKVHGGLSKAAWGTGDIPVTAFPSGSKFTSVKVIESRAKRVWLELIATTPAGQDMKGGLYYIQFVPRGDGWAVDYFGPKGYNPPVPSNSRS